ncbi:hypothetical protein THAOC_19890 [Thalassiosira oceanica]|uniref:Uncharacterized protein n=1 Tax=Thalassiosira oceanica TaxID=159749 RepID=K0S3M5_THAOC|nr:hypothetical protein THAOC_19890 [Thalassiosira oceanica]|eukprot:EJK59840.1 hypothetical protein THAOC_19890 [Thalassiosira oceanica]
MIAAMTKAKPKRTRVATSDDELAQKPTETEDIPDDGGGKQPAVMQPGIGHVPPSAEQQLSPEGNVASRASPQGGHAEDDKTKKNADSTSPVSTVDDDDGDDGDDEDVDDDSQCKKMSISPEAHRIDGGKTSRESVCSNGTSGACSSGFVTRWKEVPSPGTEMAP